MDLLLSNFLGFSITLFFTVVYKFGVGIFGLNTSFYKVFKKYFSKSYEEREKFLKLWFTFFFFVCLFIIDFLMKFKIDVIAIQYVNNFSLGFIVLWSLEPIKISQLRGIQNIAEMFIFLGVINLAYNILIIVILFINSGSNLIIAFYALNLILAIFEIYLGFQMDYAIFRKELMLKQKVCIKDLNLSSIVKFNYSEIIKGAAYIKNEHCFLFDDGKLKVLSNYEISMIDNEHLIEIDT